MIEEKTFKGKDFTISKFIKDEYESCTFLNCNFTGVDLSDTIFLECDFRSCDLSTVKLTNTAFREVSFNDCKLLGLHFDDCNKFLFSAQFNNCQLNLSSFYQMVLKNTQFNNTKLQEVDFTEAELTGSVFSNCDLTGAIFELSILEKIDFSTAFNYSINPELNRIKKAKFSKEGVLGLLGKYDIYIE